MKQIQIFIQILFISYKLEVKKNQKNCPHHKRVSKSNYILRGFIN